MGYTKDTLKGFSWMSLFRLVTRLFALLRIAILARLLNPEQFGLFGIATLALSFLEIFTETGINLFLIQDGSKIKKYLNTAWVISILRGAVISSLIYIFAQPVSAFFSGPGAERLLIFISIVPLIRGFINPYVVSFQINLTFNKEFLYRTFLFIVDAITAIVAVYLTKSEIGLVIGLLVSAIVEVLSSFIIFKTRPKFILDKNLAKEIFLRGKWITGAGIFKYLADQGDDGVVAKFLGTYNLGLYQNAYKISTLPVHEVTGVAAKVVIPVYSRIREDKARLVKAFKKAFIALFMLIVPFGLLIFVFSREIVLVVLGPNWIEAVPVLKILSIFGIVSALGNIPNSLFISLKRQDIYAKVNFIEFLFILLLIFPLLNKFNLIGVCYTVLFSSILTFPFIIYYLRKALSTYEFEK
jgi:lipopolysaccharide exporter